MTPQTTPELLHLVRDVLRDDQQIAKFCQEKYGKTQTVYLGADPRDQPPLSDYPIILIISLSRVRREERMSELFYSCEIGLGIKNEEIAEEKTTGIDTKEYLGFLEVEEFREKIENALFREQRKIGRIDTDGETILDVDFPIFRSNTIITIEQRRTFRRGIK